MGQIGEAVRRAAAKLEAAGVENALHDAWRLMALALAGDPLLLRLRAGDDLSAEQESAFDALICRRAQREPLQYIEGDTEFMGIRLRVSESVLIPRQDTETLCSEALRLLDPGDRVLDIGTGSGALAIALKRLCPGAAVTAVDISPAALEVAKENARRCGAGIEFLRSDCFGGLAGREFEMIVSNPPYLTQEEMQTLMPEVQREPEGALFGGADGLAFYRRITAEAPQHLTPGGHLLFEIGWRQKEAVSALLRESVGEPHAIRDLGGNWRVVWACRSAAACGAQGD